MKDYTRKSKGNKPENYVYRLSHANIAALIPISRGDKDILHVYKGLLGISMTAVMHEMIGTAARCWEENHPKVINKMAETIAGQKSLLFLYRAKFGRLTEDQGKDQVPLAEDKENGQKTNHSETI